MDSADALDTRRKELESRVKTGANWLWSVVALSIANTILVRLDVDLPVCVGLVITQMCDYSAVQYVGGGGSGAHTGILVGTLVLDALCVGVFALVARACSRGQRWWLLAGLVAYALDTAIAWTVQLWPSVVLHALTLGFGLRAFLAQCELARASPAEPAPSPAPRMH